MNTVIRKAVPGDIKAISDIEQSSFEAPWSEAEIAKGIASGDSYVAVIEADGRLAGYAEMRMVAGEAQIYNIAVDEACRGRGLGEALMRHLMDEALKSGCDIMTLEVRSGNEAASGLYAKLGFKEVGRRKGYYSGGGEAAVLMDLELK